MPISRRARLGGFSPSQPLHDFRVSPAHGLSVWCAQPDWPRELVLPNSVVDGGLAETDRARDFVEAEDSVFLLHEDGESPITTHQSYRKQPAPATLLGAGWNPSEASRTPMALRLRSPQIVRPGLHQWSAPSQQVGPLISRQRRLG